MNVPSELKYTKDHEWVRIEGNVATVGITDYAQDQLSDIVYLEVETLDESLDKEETFGTVEAVKTVSDLFMPVGGKVIEVNEALADNPELINKDAFGEGWLIKLEIADAAELEALMSADEYKALVTE